MDRNASAKSLPAIAEYATLRLLFVFLLYVAQGAPIGIFFFAIPAWLAANGASPAEVGLVLSATGLPWTLKFVNGFIMDRFTFLPMGRRRAWLISAQAIMVAGLIIFALVDPGPDETALLAAFSFVIMAATTYQDVAVDGMAVDLIPDNERARANGLMFGGQAIGTAAGAAFAGFAISAIGLPAAMLGNAAFVAVILMMLVVFRERPGEKLLPWTPGAASEASLARQVDAWWPLIRSVWRSMTTRDSGLHAIAQVANGMLYGLYVGTMPLIATRIGGWNDADFSALSGAGNLVAGLLGVVVFGIMTDWLGSRRSTVISFGTYILATAAFWIAMPFWADRITIQLGAFIYLAIVTWTQISICASAMKICSLKVAATQFTLFMAISNLGITLASAMLGPLEALGGYTALLASIIIVATIGGIAMSMFNEAAMQRRVKAEIAGAAG